MKIEPEKIIREPEIEPEKIIREPEIEPEFAHTVLSLMAVLLLLLNIIRFIGSDPQDSIILEVPPKEYTSNDKVMCKNGMLYYDGRYTSNPVIRPDGSITECVSIEVSSEVHFYKKDTYYTIENGKKVEFKK